MRAQLLYSNIIVSSFRRDGERMLPPECASRSSCRFFCIVSLQDVDCTRGVVWSYPKFLGASYVATRALRTCGSTQHLGDKHCYLDIVRKVRCCGERWCSQISQSPGRRMRRDQSIGLNAPCETLFLAASYGTLTFSPSQGPGPAPFRQNTLFKCSFPPVHLVEATRQLACYAYFLAFLLINMSSVPFFASSAEILAGFWTSDPDHISDHRYRHRPALPNSSITPDQRPRSYPLRDFPPNFLTLPAPNATTRTQPFRRPEGYRATVTHIERALESANTAINDAQEALELRNARTHNQNIMPPLVDLTAASPSQSPELHRHDSNRAGQFTQRHSNIMTLLNDLPPDWDPRRDFQPIDRGGSSRLPRFQGGFPDYSADRPSGPTEHRHRIVHADFSLSRGRQERPDPQEREQQAIQRQREARALWDSNQRRREALLPRRSRSRSPRKSSPPIRQRSESDVRSGSSSSRPKSESPVESIDLTGVGEKTSAADVLAQHRADVESSQNVSSDTGRTALTSYKCPICMETPTDITATICGHLFCHRCIIETLKWSEDQRGENMPGHRPKGVCPVCRKELRRIDTEQKGRTLVPLNIMLGQQVRKRKTDVKGKGVARDESGTENRKRESSSEWMDHLVNLDDT